MKITTLSTFPDLLDGVMSQSIMKRAQEKGILNYKSYDLRKWTHDNHCTTDDAPFGGGAGLVMKCEPIFEAFDDLTAHENKKPYVIIPSPVGRTFNDCIASELAQKSSLLFICGHYEGLDERIFDLSDDRLSVGDYVLTGGELATLVMVDAIVRKIPGVLGDAASAVEESFQNNLLEYPHYTRPSCFRGKEVPSVLLSGNHQEIARWRHEQRLTRTKQYRPDLLQNAKLSSDDFGFLESLES